MELEFYSDGRLSHKSAKTLRERGLKYCPKCGVVKSFEGFDKNTRLGGYQSNCSQCMSIRRDGDKERISESMARYYLSNAEEKKRKASEYYHSHKRQASEWFREYSRRNPEVIQARDQRRRARKMSAPGTHTAAELRELWKSQAGRCAYCDCEITSEYRHLDHIIPLVRGGSDSIDNLCYTCPPCNLSKKDKTIEEWNRE